MRKPKVHRSEKEGLIFGQEPMTPEEIKRYTLVTTPEEDRERWAEWKARWGANGFGFSRYKDPETERMARVFELEEERRRALRKDPAADPVATVSKKGSKSDFGTRLYIVELTNKRKEGTTAHARFAAMEKYFAAHPGMTVSEALTNTSYRKDDYMWDLNRGYIKVSDKPLKKGEGDDTEVSKRKGKAGGRKR